MQALLFCLDIWNGTSFGENFHGCLFSRDTSSRNDPKVHSPTDIAISFHRLQCNLERILAKMGGFQDANNTRYCRHATTPFGKATRLVGTYCARGSSLDPSINYPSHAGLCYTIWSCLRPVYSSECQIGREFEVVQNQESFVFAILDSALCDSGSPVQAYRNLVVASLFDTHDFLAVVVFVSPPDHSELVWNSRIGTRRVWHTAQV
mmetsp:Transcript_317/g.713  ORF Transcript_317/g.713 Transcript_317/m.713 type:complete len:206 (-) Transcript_317:6-623(-)